MGYGGILYNLIVLSRLSRCGCSIWPVVNIGQNHEKEIMARIRSLPLIMTDAIRTVPAPNNHCRLHYTNASEKTEKLSGWVGGVRRRQIRKIVDSDYILVNYISGSDISTANLTWLRGQTQALIYIDFHSRTLGRNADGSRYLRRPRDWKETVLCADILQMNEIEFRLLAKMPPGPKACKNFMFNHMAESALCLLVTLGEQGCLLSFRRRSDIITRRAPANLSGQIVDTTGCGDIFAGAFLSRFVQRRAIVAATHFAVRVASMRAKTAALEDFELNQLKGLGLLGSVSE